MPTEPHARKRHRFWLWLRTWRWNMPQIAGLGLLIVGLVLWLKTPLTFADVYLPLLFPGVMVIGTTLFGLSPLHAYRHVMSHIERHNVPDARFLRKFDSPCDRAGCHMALYDAGYRTRRARRAVINEGLTEAEPG